jgi:hypothetical protein
VHRHGVLAVHGAETVGAGVAAADDDDVLAGRRDGRGCVGWVSDPAVAPVQVVHREVHAVELAAGHRQVARHARADRQHDRVERPAQLVDGDVAADVDAAAQLDALGEQLLHAPLDDALLDLEVRHAEAAEAARGLVTLEQHDVVARTSQLLRGRHPRGTGADDRDGAAGLDARRLRHDPALAPGAVDDRLLDLLDRDGVALADLEHAGGLARRGAEAAGELGEVVRCVQLPDRVAPAVAVDEVVPVRDQVAERAAVVAKRHAALHAARALLAQLLDRPRDEELVVGAAVIDALARVAVTDARALDAQEAAELAHYAATSSEAGVSASWRASSASTRL